MANYIRILTEGGESVLVEVDKTIVPVIPSGEIKAGIPEMLGKIVDNVVDVSSKKVQTAVNAAINLNVNFMYQAIKTLPNPPTECEIEIGFKFTAEGDIAVAKIDAEYNYSIKLTWKPEK